MTAALRCDLADRNADRGEPHHHHPDQPEDLLVLKKLLILVVTAVGAVAGQQKVRDQRAEQDMWSEDTEAVRYTPVG